MTHIVHIEIDDQNLPVPTPEIEQERRVAMFDLLEQNNFVLPARGQRDIAPGPYRVRLSIKEKRLVFDVGTETQVKVA